MKSVRKPRKKNDTDYAIRTDRQLLLSVTLAFLCNFKGTPQTVREIAKDTETKTLKS